MNPEKVEKIITKKLLNNELLLFGSQECAFSCSINGFSYANDCAVLELYLLHVFVFLLGAPPPG